MYRKNTAGQFCSFQGVDATTGGIKSGVTWNVRRCIDNTFAAGGGTVAEDSTNGWYTYAMSQADTNGNDIAFNFTGTGAIPQTVNILTTAANPADGIHFGLSALPNTAVSTNASLLTSGTGTDQLSVASGRVDVGKLLGTAWLTPAVAGTPDVTVLASSRSGIRKNVALSNFGILMKDSSGIPVTGLTNTVTLTRSIDSATTFSAGTISVSTEIANGWYMFDLGNGDLNGTSIKFRATAAGCVDLDFSIITNP